MVSPKIVTVEVVSRRSVLLKNHVLNEKINAPIRSSTFTQNSAHPNMKKYLHFIPAILVMVLLASCGQSAKKSGSLPPVNIEIPAELKDKPELVAFIKESEMVINAFTVSAEDMVDNMKPYAGKDFDELGMAGKMRVMAIMGNAAMSFAEFTVKQAEIMDQGQFFEEQLNEEQAQAICMVLHTFAERLELLEEKFSELDRK